MKKEIEVFEYAGDIMRALKAGVLLTTKVGDKVNSMTIGWGNLGIVWGKATLHLSVKTVLQNHR